MSRYDYIVMRFESGGSLQKTVFPLFVCRRIERSIQSGG